MILSYCSLQKWNLHPASSKSFHYGHTTENFTYLVVTSIQCSFLRLCNFSGSWAVSLQILLKEVYECKKLEEQRVTSALPLRQLMLKTAERQVT